jgi:hypothetical protein
MPKQDMEKMELRKNFRNVWHTDLTHSIQNDTPCNFSLSLFEICGLDWFWLLI